MRTIWRTCGLFLLLLLWLQDLNALEPDEVFSTVSPSVVKFSTMEMSGSGVVLSEGGLILTNYHVINSPLPLKMTAKVKVRNGQAETRVFQTFEYKRVHKIYDLALIKVTDPDVTFAPVELLPKTQKLRTGETCYVIGNPDGGALGSLDNSITAGLISSASRNIDGLDYIQIGAAINPGNSGGVVCTGDAMAVGIVTYKLDGVEGVGFAIPTQMLAMADFIAPEDKKGDPQKALEWQAEGNRMLSRVGLANTLEEKEFFSFLGLLCYRQALAELPNDPVLLFNAGDAYRQLGADVAQSYFAESAKFDPHFSPSQNELALAAIDRGDIAKAVEHWRLGSQDPNEKRREAVAHCLDNWARVEAQRGDYLRAYYLIQWASEKFKDSGTVAARRKIVSRNARSKLPEEVANFMDAKGSEFSLDDMAEMVKTLENKIPKSMVELGGDQEMSRETIAEGDPIVAGLRQYAISETRVVTYEIPNSGTQVFQIEDALEGVTIEGNRIVWSIPAGSSVAECRVLLSYEESGVTHYRIEKLSAE